jgi:A/G-specific adenine glycosylase
MIDDQKQEAFIADVWGYFNKHQRSMPWRENTDPYWIIVSEIMLQQTQVERVIPKFEAFIRQFPSVQALAMSHLVDVLQAWVGLGYNRRARFLWLAANQLVQEYGGAVPNTVEELVKLPGIGPNTAAAILAYAYNQPVIFIETNIRTVYLHYFYQNEVAVEDSRLWPLIEKTVDADNPREWYWALMDYGTFLKKTIGNPNRRSRHYVRQSAFEGSLRQIRGQVIRELAYAPHSMSQLQNKIADARLTIVLEQLKKEGFITLVADRVQLKEA